MTDRYIIEEQTTDTGFKYVLIETGFKPTKLGEYPSKSQAENSKTEWIARDDLQEKVSNFLDEILIEFKGKLEDKEIREIIHEA